MMVYLGRLGGAEVSEIVQWSATVLFQRLPACLEEVLLDGVAWSFHRRIKLVEFLANLYL